MMSRLAAFTEPVRDTWLRPGSEPRVIRGITYILLAFGLAAVFSASTVESLTVYGNAWEVFLRQLAFAVVGVGFMLLADRLPLRTVRALAWPAFLAVVALLLIVLGVGSTVNGQRNWIAVGPLSLQPSEFAKLAFVIVASERVAVGMRRGQDARQLARPVLLIAGLLIGLVLLERDMGNVLVIAGMAIAMLFALGYPLRVLGAWALLGLIGTAVILIAGPGYRADRILCWRNPYSDPLGCGWQWIHGNYALAIGGLLGQGPGASKEKWGALPEAHTDFILSVIGEEYGFIGTCITVGLILALLVLLLRAAINVEDPYRRLLIAGVASWLFMQSLFNIGAVVGFLPIIGVTLPLVSYGGSSLLPMLVALGLVVRCLVEPAARQEVRA